AIRQGNRDMLTKTAMLESRCLTGDAKLAQAFRDQFRAKCVVGYERQYVEMRMEDQSTRHAKFGGSVYMQEPNVKNGCGGLRDYQNMLWIAYFKQGVGDTAGLLDRKLLSEGERRRLDRAYDFLMRVRTELHYLNKRPLDGLAMNF